MDVMFAEGALLVGHRVEELPQPLGELVGALEVRLDQAREKLTGQQADVFREEAEEQAHEEVSGPLRGHSARAKAFGQFGELRGGGFGDLRGSLSGLQPAGVGEDGAQHVQRCELAGRSRLVLDEVGQFECEYLLLRIGVVGVHLEAIEVADYELGRVLQVFAILEQLLIGRVQVLVFAFVFPGKEPAHPDVGEAAASGRLGNAFLESVGISFLIHFRGGGLSENLAEADEMLLRRAAFGKRRPLPASYELRDG